MADFSDTFTETNDTALGSHTPDIGAGWNVPYGSISVIGGAGYAKAMSTSAGHRALATTDVGALVDVQADITMPVTQGFVGLIARSTATNTTNGYEFYWSSGWYLEGPVGTVITSTAGSWPGGSVTMRMDCRAEAINCYVNNVLKLTSSVDVNLTTGKYCGVLLGDFSGASSSNSPRVDNFSITIYTAPSGHVQHYFWQMRNL